MSIVLTKAQQALLDECEDGEMESSVPVSDDRSNKSILALLRELERRGYIRVLRRERKRNRARRLRAVWTVILTAEGLAQHAPPPGWPDQEDG